MFVLDVCQSMGSPHTFTLPDGRTQEITNLQWALKYIKLKIQEMARALYLLFFSPNIV